MGHEKTKADLKYVAEERMLQLSELEKLRNDSYDNARIYKKKTKRWHDQRIIRREFKVGEVSCCITQGVDYF